MTESENGWLEAAIAWEVCASLHRQYCKGKDNLFTTRQADFVKHAENARMRASHGQAPAVGTIGHVGDGKTTLTAAIASLLAPTPQADSQPAPGRDYPPLPQGWPARFRCDSCDGNGEVGEPMYMGHFQPPERARCPDCDGRGWCSEEAAFSADHMRAYVDADRAARAPADSVLEDAARYRWLADYLVGDLTDLDDEIVACKSVYDLSKVVDAARKQGANHD